MSHTQKAEMLIEDTYSFFYRPFSFDKYHKAGFLSLACKIVFFFFFFSFGESRQSVYFFYGNNARTGAKLLKPQKKKN